MKIVKVKPFGMFKITDEALKAFEKQTATEEESESSFNSLVNTTKKDIKVAQFIAIDPDNKNLFTFVPIIEKNQFFASAFPDPVQLYYSLAHANFQFARHTRHNIIAQHSQGGSINLVSEYLYNWHLKYKISAIIFLHCTVEAFINSLMPESFIFKQEFAPNKADKFIKQTKEYNKEQTERFIQFKEKLNDVVTQITNIDFQKSHQKTYDKLINLNGLRNDIVHLRSIKEKNSQHFEKAFSTVINTDLNDYVDAVKDFINIIKPDFIELSEIEKSDKKEFTFNFENFTAFKTDISIFIKILDVPFKNVVLNLPKSDHKHFQTAMNWIQQNLDVLAKQQLIFFPTIEELEDKFVIRIIKTDKKLGENPEWDK